MLKVDFELDMFMFYTTLVAVGTAFLYVFFDVNYFLRVIVTILYGRLFQKKHKLNEEVTMYGACFTQDLDIVFRHMNNARFVRELDFARFHFFDITGLFRIIQGASAHALQSACNIRYRRTIPIFTFYKITTKIIYWDEKNTYLEHNFITIGDGFIRATALSKQTIVGLNVPEVIAKLLDKDVSYRPEITDDLKYWMQSMDASSAKLRKKD